MELKDLVGEHMLDGVDFDTAQFKDLCDQYENCNVMRFRLDGAVYCAAEDPDDGYRSCMRDLAVISAGPMNNTFEPVRVIGRHRTKGTYGDEDDVLELIDVETGGVVIEVGTESVYDYYPCYVAAFHPEHMKPNH